MYRTKLLASKALHTPHSLAASNGSRRAAASVATTPVARAAEAPRVRRLIATRGSLSWQGAAAPSPRRAPAPLRSSSMAEAPADDAIEAPNGAGSDDEGSEGGGQKLRKRTLALHIAYVGTDFNGERARLGWAGAPVGCAAADAPAAFRRRHARTVCCMRVQRAPALAAAAPQIAVAGAKAPAQLHLAGPFARAKHGGSAGSGALPAQTMSPARLPPPRPPGLQANREQPHVATVEGVLEKALFEAGMISPANYGDFRKTKWARSSRTDKGVSSLCTVRAAAGSRGTRRACGRRRALGEGRPSRGCA